MLKKNFFFILQNLFSYKSFFFLILGTRIYKKGSQWYVVVQHESSRLRRKLYE